MLDSLYPTLELGELAEGGGAAGAAGRGVGHGTGGDRPVTGR
jgi:hypothetical protein